MNNKIKNIIKNFSYSIGCQAFSLIVSIVTTFLIPKIFGLTEYGYWQLYVFYTSYIGFFHFGLIDGIYLRYGGQEYAELDKPLFASQLRLLLFIEAIVCMSFTFYGLFNANDINRKIIIIMTGVCCIIVIPLTLFNFILQATNKIKYYAKSVFLERSIYISLILLIILLNNKNFKALIFVDIITKTCSLIYISWFCKEIIICKATSFKVSLNESLTNISVGIKLMFANIASMLIIGIVRFSIEKVWSVEVFGKISLALSISNFLLIFINAIGVVIFPLLRRTDESKLSHIYKNLRVALTIVLLGLLVLFYPTKSIFGLWLPQYADSMLYMAMLFPICIFEAKMAMLIGTYMKSLRKEKWMLGINLFTLFISGITTYIFAFRLKNLIITVLSIVFLLAIRCILSEVLVTRALKIKVYKDILIELVMTSIFILSSWFLGNILGMAIYVVSYIIYLIIKYKDIVVTGRTVLNILKRGVT